MCATLAAAGADICIEISRVFPITMRFANGEKNTLTMLHFSLS